jgi:hypothetical protein
MVRDAGLTDSSMAFFLAMLAIITLQVGGSVTQTQQHWTFIPHPPLDRKDQTYRFTPMVQSWWEATLMGT